MLGCIGTAQDSCRMHAPLLKAPLSSLLVGGLAGYMHAFPAQENGAEIGSVLGFVPSDDEPSQDLGPRVSKPDIMTGTIT